MQVVVSLVSLPVVAHLSNAKRSDIVDVVVCSRLLKCGPYSRPPLHTMSYHLLASTLRGKLSGCVVISTGGFSSARTSPEQCFNQVCPLCELW
jgi:hypothetical protein